MKDFYDREKYEDWCFDCEHCVDKFCTLNSTCENGKLWEPQNLEDDFDD
jgi:hypothetical protein